MLTKDQVKERLKDRNLMAVSAATGLAYMSVYRVARGMDKQVTYETIKRLSDYLGSNP